MQPELNAQQIVLRPLDTIRSNPRNARRHPKSQVRKLSANIAEVGFIGAIVVDEKGVILAGHARYAAVQRLGLAAIPTIVASGLTETQKRLFAIADNKLPEAAGWDSSVVVTELDALKLAEPSLDLADLGFTAGELDSLFAGQIAEAADPGDLSPAVESTPVSRPGDLWLPGRHRVLCGDARDQADMDHLMAGELARMFFGDPPYNVPIRGHVQGRGKNRHPEFAFASGEMTSAQFQKFLTEGCLCFAKACRDSAIGYLCIDWRHFREAAAAVEEAGCSLLNVVVWNKTNAAQGSFYRSQHELILVLKVGTGEHVNAVQLGKYGRARSNVWTYAGVNTFRAGRADELAMHPTVKPVALVADAIRDCTIKGDIVLDAFLGSGTTIMAAEKVGRRGFGMEVDPRYVDVAVRRWQAFTKADAVLEGDGRTFDEVAAERLQAGSAPDESPAEADSAISAEPDWVSLCQVLETGARS